MPYSIGLPMHTSGNRDPFASNRSPACQLLEGQINTASSSGVACAKDSSECRDKTFGIRFQADRIFVTKNAKVVQSSGCNDHRGFLDHLPRIDSGESALLDSDIVVFSPLS